MSVKIRMRKQKQSPKRRKVTIHLLLCVPKESLCSLLFIYIYLLHVCIYFVSKASPSPPLMPLLFRKVYIINIQIRKLSSSLNLSGSLSNRMPTPVLLSALIFQKKKKEEMDLRKTTTDMHMFLSSFVSSNA